MIKDIKELNFLKYATLETASATIADMGDCTITSQVKIDGDVVPDFSYDWEIEFKGERYIHPIREPQGAKDNTSRKSKIDLTFYHWAIYEMKRQYFVVMASTTAGTAIADKYIASLGLNLGDFVTAFNLVLNHYFDGRIIIRLNPEWQYDTEVKFVSISYSYIWDVLQQMHETYGVRWTLKTNAEGVCEILMGYPSEEVSHIFEYGFEGGLLSVQRQVQNTDIRNRLLGRGGEKNLPYRYFKDKDPNNPLFEADPDWIPELDNIAFTELRGKTFRDYVRGWKAKRYGGTPMAEPTEAYLLGYNAEKFDPIEYVEDKDSIAKYGVFVGALENNEEIYPSIQGAPGDVDMIVDAEQVRSDDVESSVGSNSVVSNINGSHTTMTNVANGAEVTIRFSERSGSTKFSVPSGSVGTILPPSFSLKGRRGNGRSGYQDVDDGLLTIVSTSFTVHEQGTNQDVSINNIPAGDYYYEAIVVARNDSGTTCNITASVSEIKMVAATTNATSEWKSTFDIWIRNIWGTSKNAGETDQQYADRVWLPILGDRLGNEAKIVFSSGRLSFSSDWEFTIVGYAYDDTKTDSHWRLTLAKSEAELEASGKYIPYEGYNASAGDSFFFIGIELTHQYILWAEERLDDHKRDTLLQTSKINPSWVVKTDKVRLNQERSGAKLIDSLSAGAQIRLASKQFVSGAYESLYIQSITYNWQTDTLLCPDVEIVLSDKVATVKNPVAMIQSNVESLQKQVGSLSNIQQIIRQVCDTLYLRKDGIKDISLSPTEFRGLVSGQGFRQGNVGGSGWGFYRDANGRSVAEFDKLVVRNDMEINNLVVNEVTHVGGKVVYSGANMICSAVEETENGYKCFFDQKSGTVVNLFAVNDIAWCQKFNADNTSVKYYKRIVTETAETYIVLSKSMADGDDIPDVNDNIIHFGNISDKNRQSAIIVDPLNGGSVVVFAGIDSFDITDRNYIGMGVNPVTNKAFLYGYGDMFFGDRTLESNFITFQNGRMVVNADVTFGADTTGLSNLSEWKSFKTEYDETVVQLGKDVEQTTEDLNKAIEDAEKAAKDYTDEGKAALQKSIDELNAAKAGINEVYTKSAADGLINSAEQRANEKAQEVADEAQRLAELNANAYADGVADDAELAAIADADAKLATAKGELNASIEEVREIASTADAATKTLDTKITNVETGITESVNEINARLDGVVENYFEEGVPTTSNYPANEWITDADKANHVGDTYTNISSYDEDPNNAGKSWRWTFTDSEHTGYHWHPIADSDAVKALLEASKAKTAADGKARNFVTQPKPPYSVGDTWMQGSSGDIMRCKVARETGSYTASDWEIAAKYTDDTKANEAMAKATNASTLAQNASDEAATATETSNAASAVSEAAKNLANEAKSNASEAITKSNTAQDIANDAKDIADSAQDLADSAKTLAQTAKTNADKAVKDASDAKSEASTATSKLSDWSSDSVISPFEKQGVKDELAFVVADKNDIDKQATKYELTTNAAYTTFGSKFTAYKNDLTTITNATTESVSIPSGMTTHQSEYYTARTTLLEAIATAAKKVATDAQTAADTAQTAADNAKTAADNAQGAADKAQEAADAAQTKADNAAAEAKAAKDTLTEWASDGVISPVEKQALKTEMNKVLGEYDEIRHQTTIYDSQTLLDSWRDYADAWTLYVEELENIIIEEGSVEIGDLASLQSSYYDARTTVLSDIANAAKAFTDSKVSPNDVQYLKDTFGQVTSGDVFLAKLMGVGKRIDENNFTVNAFLNGDDAISGTATEGKLMLATGIPATDPIYGTDLAKRAENASTRIYEKGKIVSKDVELEGKITATSGKIGVCEIDENGYIQIDTPAVSGKMSLSEYGLGIGANGGVAPRAQIGSCGGALVQAFATGGETPHCPNESYHIAIQGSSDKAAFFCGKGMFYGLRPMTRTVSSGTTLNEFDYNVFCSSGTVYLPSSPLLGQTYDIFHTSTSSITISGNGKTIYALNGTSGLTSQTQFSTSQARRLHLVYNGNAWYLDSNMW